MLYVLQADDIPEWFVFVYGALDFGLCWICEILFYYFSSSVLGPFLSCFLRGWVSSKTSSLSISFVVVNRQPEYWALRFRLASWLGKYGLTSSLPPSSSENVMQLLACCRVGTLGLNIVQRWRAPWSWCLLFVSPNIVARWFMCPSLVVFEVEGRWLCFPLAIIIWP